jgi:hypothetical protein
MMPEQNILCDPVFKKVVSVIKIWPDKIWALPLPDKSLRSIIKSDAELVLHTSYRHSEISIAKSPEKLAAIVL